MAKLQGRGFRNWKSLPTEILELIAERLEIFEDFLCFCMVCKSWQSVTSILGDYRTLPSKSPWVMLPDIAEKNYPIVTDSRPCDMLVKEAERNEYIEGMNKRRFFSFATSKTYEFELPEATRRKCYGVGYGWLLTFGYDLQINLLDPFTRQQISMPPWSSFKTENNPLDMDIPKRVVISNFITKVVMSSNPKNNCNEDCIVMVIYGKFRTLAFARPGDKVWTDIDAPRRVFADIVYYKEKFFAVSIKEVYVIDLNEVNDPKAELVYRVNLEDGCGDRYLVESSGSLLLVSRFFSMKHDSKELFTSNLIINKLKECFPEESNNYCSFKLTRIDSLGDRSLFLGYNASVSVHSSKCVKANCVYFLDYGGGDDTGIYDFKRKKIILHYASQFMSRLTPPLWLI